MEQLLNRCDDFLDQQVQQVMSNAFSSLREIFVNTNPRQRSNNSRLSLRYRSSSNHRPERKLPFYHTIPRCSLPSTKTDLIHYRSRVSSSDQLYPHYIHRHRTCDIQYSFSLHQSWANEMNSSVTTIEKYAHDIIEQSIRVALGHIEGLSSSSQQSKDEDVPMVMNFVDQWISQTMEQSMERLFQHTIEQLLDPLTEDILNDALSIIAEKQISTRTFSIDHGKSNDQHETIQTMVNTIAQRIYSHSLEYLRE